MTSKLAEQASPGICPDEQPRQTDLAELAGCYRETLNKYFTRRLRDAVEAEDMTQEVLLRIARRPRSQAIRTAGAFLFHVAQNLLRDRARAEKARSQLVAHVHQCQRSAEELSPERVIQARETLRSVLTGLRCLNDQARDIFMLHRLENMKYHEIAKLYGISESAVEKHMMKALASVAKHMNRP